MEKGRVVTAELPEELFALLDEISGRIDRTKSWIIRAALSEWLADEQLRYQLTLDALAAVDRGLMLSHEEVVARAEQRRKARQQTNSKS